MSTEVLAPPKPEILAIPPGNIALVPIDQPSGLHAMTMPRSNGDKSQLEILAWVDLPTTNPKPGEAPTPASALAFCRDKTKGPERDWIEVIEFRGRRVVQGGTIPIGPSPSPHAFKPQGSALTCEFAVVAKRQDMQGPALAIGFAKQNKTDIATAEPTIRTGKDTAHISEETVSHAVGVKSRIQKIGESLKRNGKRFLGAVAVYATIASGGLIDRAVEGHHDASFSVEQRLSNYDTRPTWLKIGDESNTESQAEYHQSVMRVARTMEDLDTHNTPAINERAEAFRKEFAHELMPTEMVESFRKRLDETKTMDDVMLTFHEFLSFYGKSAQFLENDSKSFNRFDFENTTPQDVANLVREFVDTYSYLPQSLIKNAKFGIINLSGLPHPEHWHKAAIYSRNHEIDSGIMIFPVYNGAIKALHPVGSGLAQEINEPGSMSELILHELGHALDKKLGDLEQPGEERDSNPLTHTLKKLAGVQDEQSYYAVNEEIKERRVENFGNALDVRSSTGLSHPDELRAFLSGANTKRLEILQTVDAKYPGFADHLVSLRLNNYKVWRAPILPFVRIGG